MHVLAPYLDEIVVVWVNTGAAYESTLKQMHQVRDTVPHFFEVATDQPADIEKFGYPTDILPIRHDIQLLGTLTPKLQSSASCCAKNIWYPIKLAIKDLGVRSVYSGAREDEDANDPRWLAKVDEVQYLYPLRKWTLKMVQDYAVKHNIMLPPYYSQGEEKSRDCWNCTGYLYERRASIAALPFYQKEEILDRLRKIEDAVGTEMKNIDTIQVDHWNSTHA